MGSPLRYTLRMTGPGEIETRLRGLYGAFNARDINEVLAIMADDVDWPNAWEGGRVTGRRAIREYWERQWQAIDPHVEPLSFRHRPDGKVEVQVTQVVRSLEGAVVVAGDVTHVYTFRDGLVIQMDLVEPEADHRIPLGR